MTTPSRPRMQRQNPKYSGYSLGWLSCSAFGMAMGIDKATLGRKRPSGEDVRRETGDTTGGLTLPQVARVAEVEYAVQVDVRVGSNVASPALVGHALHAGRGVCVQGGTRPLLDSPYRSTSGPINHFVYANEGRGWKQVLGVWVPDEVLVFDPAADGRWSWTDVGPTWWPWAELKAFGYALQPWGEDDPRTLGIGKLYAGLMPDTEPHAHFRYGGRRTSPFPDRTRTNVADGRRVNVRRRPDRLVADDIVERLPDGRLFIAYQRTEVGASVRGSRTWYGNHDGTRWIHESGLRHEGGAS